MNDCIKNEIDAILPGNWRFEGFLEERIVTFSKARLMSEYACQEIYPETEEAFRQREDDRSHPGRGVWRGEFWGKYILSAVAACRYYSSEELKNQILYAVKGLLSTQDDDDYIGTYSDSKCFGDSTWNIWCRKYTLWGLLEAWELLKEDFIIEAAACFVDHLMTEVGPGKHDIIQTGQFMGLPSTSMLKPIVLLYRATDNKRYLEFAEYIVEQWSKHPNGPPDILNKGIEKKAIHIWFPKPYDWAKAYEFVSCLEGLLELYRVNGKPEYLKAAENIHAAIVEWECTPVGSMSFNDKFIGSRYLINTVAEICDAVYWNRLSFELLLLTGNVSYMDEIERAIYNALLCGMKQDGTWGLRRLRLSHEHIPAHSHFLKHHQCCVDNLPRGLFQAAQSAVFTDMKGIYITLYNAGKGIVALPSGNEGSIVLEGDFPGDGKITMKISLKTPEDFITHFRVPHWSGNTSVTVNQEPAVAGLPQSWISIERVWKSGDIISISLDVNVRAEVFDTSRFSADDELVAWHEKEWASMGFMQEDNVKLTSKQISQLKVEDALPHKKAVMFFSGPVALSRDTRFNDGDLLEPLLQESELIEQGVLKSVTAPKGIWKAYELTFPNEKSIKLCDFSSSGNTWDEKSRFSTWQLVE